MKIRYTCSNCGKHFTTSAMVGVPEGMYFSGVRVVGDAVYCEDCANASGYVSHFATCPNANKHRKR